MSTERRILHAPGWIARAAAAVAPEAEQRWMLSQPAEVRRSFAAEVLGHPDEEVAQQVWMLFQPAEVRHSYVEEVLIPAGAPREEIWMLRQSDEICRDYARFVLLEEG